MQAAEIIDKIISAGGRIWLEEDKVRARLPEILRPLVSVIHARKPELVEELVRRPTMPAGVRLAGWTPKTPPVQVPSESELEPDEFNPWRKFFVEWFDANIRLDAEWLALRRRDPQWRTDVSDLHAAFCRWMFAQGEVPPLRAEFRHLLEELCCDIRNVGGEQLVLGLALKEDV
jgi:hypothetical protein